MTCDRDENTYEMAKTLISSKPELRNNIYSFITSLVATIEASQPQAIRDKDAKVESLQRQLLAALNNGNEKTRKAEKLEADLKVATDSGLSQVLDLEAFHRKVKKQEETEKNLRKGILVLQKELDPLRNENTRMKRQLQDAEKEIRGLAGKVDYQRQRFEIYSQRTCHIESKTARMESHLRKLEEENHLLVLKGEQMSGRLLAVAEQWHEPTPTSRKRQASEVLDEGERLRGFSRMTR
jgi:chromosome segregation ATPase